MGCGVACVASVAGVTYEKALKYFKKKSVLTRGCYCRDIVKALDKFGIEYKYKKFARMNLPTPDGTIVFISHSNKYPEGHYLVRIGKAWMNPWINYPHIVPIKAGFSKRLPGNPRWIIYPQAKKRL